LENKNYYKELKTNIKNLLQEDNLSEALKIIEEELSLPYVPLETEEFLNKALSEVKQKLFTEEKLINLDKILDILSSNVESVDKFDLSMNLADYNLSKNKEEIKALLLLKEEVLAIETKKNILQLLLEQGDKGK
jgi:hypothetical protein